MWWLPYVGALAGLAITGPASVKSYFWMRLARAEVSHAREQELERRHKGTLRALAGIMAAHGTTTGRIKRI